jgi:DNA-binding transcriptional ArsR family regulator
MYVNSASALYRLLGDETRLRLLRILSLERLNVTELTGILDIAQSGVSRHLGLLRDAGLVVEEREGGFSYYRLPQAEDPNDPLRSLLQAQFDASAADPAARADESRLQEVRRIRKENFETHGSETRQLVPGRSWAAWARALCALLPPLHVADLGCGDGYLTIEAARFARRVIAVDRSSEVLDRARALAARRRVTNVTWRKGEIESVPIADTFVDLALLSQRFTMRQTRERRLQRHAVSSCLAARC